jgi:hypothetical protein
MEYFMICMVPLAILLVYVLSTMDKEYDDNE